MAARLARERIVTARPDRRVVTVLVVLLAAFGVCFGVLLFAPDLPTVTRLLVAVWLGRTRRG